MRRYSITSRGMASTTTQAPWVNLLISSTAPTTAVISAPTPLTRARVRQPRSRSLHQCITIPAWERVKLMNTPTA